MARESFDKEIQFLRMLVLTSGAYDRQQYARRLGISVHTFDKTIRRLKEVLGTVYRQLPGEESREFADMLRYRYYESADPLLLFLYRAKSLKESESRRLALLLASLQKTPQTALELLDTCCSELPDDAPLPDEKTIRSDLKYLEEVGVIRREPGPRPYRYRLQDGLLTDLSFDELCDLYDYVDIMANTQVPSVQGYLLRDSLKRALRNKAGGMETADRRPLQERDSLLTEPFCYKYHYPSRILDEAHLHTLLHAIEHRRRIQFLYFSPKSGAHYGSRNTNPLFERETSGTLESAQPLRVVYDHQYGRWYLLAAHPKMGIRTYRVEGMTQIVEGEEVSEDVHLERQQALQMNVLGRSWLLDTSRPVKVRARFYRPAGGQPDWIRERVELQGQWGCITEEDETSFVYEIEVSGTTEIKPWLRSFGSSCEVLEPRRLRQELIDEWKEIEGYYEAQDSESL
ncbi:helix-turn-helix transcriptional regulator [Paenibacillus caseinilyticus]|uniref:Transcriptional regulator n=1 Tax=Paenibacillus mucilaginosus K02 TaxID=997761 RepID=I0BTE7_9BACL|nr:WYL domain-containing protein [Paenibacillus mucilaginosus]AFH65644.1 transcriptional regulator [Paenibacillus mucilaginosus K02]